MQISKLVSVYAIAFASAICAADVPPGGVEVPLNGDRGGGQSGLFIDSGKKVVVGRKRIVEVYDVEKKTMVGSQEIKGGAVNVILPADSDGSHLLVGAGTMLSVLDSETIKLGGVFEMSGPGPRFVGVIPAGGLFWFAAGTNIKCFDIQSGAAKDCAIAPVAAPLSAFAIATDGSHLAYAVQGAGAGDVTVVDVKTGKVTSEIKGKSMNVGMPPPAVSSVVFSPDSKEVAVNIGLGPLRRHSVETGQLIAEYADDAGVLVAYSGDGTMFARVTQNASMQRTVTVYKLSGGSVVAKLPVGKVSVTSLAFSHDGKLLVIIPAAKAFYLCPMTVGKK